MEALVEPIMDRLPGRADGRVLYLVVSIFLRITVGILLFRVTISLILDDGLFDMLIDATLWTLLIGQLMFQMSCYLAGCRPRWRNLLFIR